MGTDGDATLGAYAEECIKRNPDGVFCIDHLGTILFANASFAAMTGVPEDGLLGTGIFRFFPSVDPSDRTFADHVGHGRILHAEAPLARSDGSQVFVNVTVSSVMREEAGHHIAFCFVRGLGERERMAHALEGEVRKREKMQLDLEKTNERLRSLVMTDQLTGAASRRLFIEEAERRLTLVTRIGGKLSLAIFDVDFFKQVNDGFGHLAGDRVLERLIATIRSVLRPSDLIARWGGDEFVILLPGTDMQGARALSTRIKKAVEAYDFGVDLPITVSIGLAEVVPGDDADALVARADQALYRAKRYGRNRFEAEGDCGAEEQLASMPVADA